MSAVARYLEQVREAQRSEWKKEITIEMFEYMGQSKYDWESTKLASTVRAKIEEYANTESPMWIKKCKDALAPHMTFN